MTPTAEFWFRFAWAAFAALVLEGFGFGVEFAIRRWLGMTLFEAGSMAAGTLGYMKITALYASRVQVSDLH